MALTHLKSRQESKGCWCRSTRNCSIQ